MKVLSRPTLRATPAATSLRGTHAIPKRPACARLVENVDLHVRARHAPLDTSKEMKLSPRQSPWRATKKPPSRRIATIAFPAGHGVQTAREGNNQPRWEAIPGEAETR